MSDSSNFNPADFIVKLRGKEYLEVASEVHRRYTSRYERRTAAENQ